MFRRILVPLDGSARAEQALPIAARIARAAGGSVMLLRVVSIPREFGPSLRTALQHEVIDAAIANVTTYLSKTAQAHSLAGVATKVAVLAGPAALTILDTAQEQQSDLILIASHGATGFKRWALGSVAQQVARSSPVPVLVLRERGAVPSSSYPDKTRPLHTVAAVVALDGSQLAEAAILPAANLVAALAAPAAGSLHLTRVVQRPGVAARLRAREHMDPQQSVRASTEAMEYLCQLADDLRTGPGADLNLAISWSITLDPNVADALIKVAEQGNVGVPASSAAAISWPWQHTGAAVYNVWPLAALQSTSLAVRNFRSSLCDRNESSLSLHQLQASRLNESRGRMSRSAEEGYQEDTKQER